MDQTGFNKNWWVGLAVLHNLFAREHNAIVAMLRAAHPELDEQGLYDRARLINAAQIAKIHTIEWTPATLPNPTVTAGLYSNWYGLKRFVPPGTDLSPILAFVQTLPADQQASITTAIQGVIGSPRNLLGHAYALTEEFSSVYRMHALLPDRLVIRSADGRSQRRRIYRTERTAFGGARAVQEREELADLVYSFGVGRGGALTLANHPAFLQQLRLPTGAVLDMGTVDVLRDRERGIPRYNDFREQLRLKRVPSIEELTPDAELRAALHEVYGDDAAAIDRVHFPQLARTGLGAIENAFMPWPAPVLGDSSDDGDDSDSD